METDSERTEQAQAATPASAENASAENAVRLETAVRWATMSEAELAALMERRY